MSSVSPKSTAPTESSSRFMARAMTPFGKLEQLAGHALLEAVDARDAVADGQDRARLGGFHPGGEARRAAPG